VQLRDSSGNRIASDSIPGRINVTCFADTSVVYHPTFWVNRTADEFCAPGYPAFVSHTNGVWHYKVMVRPGSNCFDWLNVTFGCSSQNMRKIMNSA
jgi:hypothetical protein